MKKNILLTSVSAKTLLIKSFVVAAEKYGLKVFTSDIQKYTAASFFGHEHFVLPRSDDEQLFIRNLRKVCIKNNVGMIVPTRDGEILLMSRIKQQFEKDGIFILTPQFNVADLCLNKEKTHGFLLKNGFDPIPIIRKKDLGKAEYPLFVRPISGSAGKGAQKINSKKDLNFYMATSKDILIHPYIDMEEYSIDLLMDLSGKYLQSVCRERIFIVAGESKISKIFYNKKIEEFSRRLGESFCLVGHNVIQIFYSKQTKKIFVIEINPRFGGASNLSIVAGLNSPERIIRMFLGKKDIISKINYNLTMYRFSDDMIVEVG